MNSVLGRLLMLIAIPLVVLAIPLAAFNAGSNILAQSRTSAWKACSKSYEKSIDDLRDQRDTMQQLLQRVADDMIFTLSNDDEWKKHNEALNEVRRYLDEVNERQGP